MTFFKFESSVTSDSTDSLVAGSPTFSNQCWDYLTTYI